MEFRASAEGSVAPRVGMRSVADGPGPSMSYKGGLHPVDELQQRMVRDDINGRIQRIRHMHGNGAALIAQMELAVVSQAQRLPGLRSSNIGLETLLNTGASLDVTDYLNDPDYSECPRDSRAIMERRLGLL
ncbi:Proteasome maturation protein [Plasmodiophora brassicae]|uniref:Proteasome maturation protein n=1 Tax=Plasmodiophora brassicae TaxID=37360 RepID=A0A0G4ILX1_PLABS|nr:hypothetical protein PBRA_004782 [Plasmodiophora brassicae]SPQ93364.1 unnamed protein product [Plasmodiophora brassicae]